MYYSRDTDLNKVISDAVKSGARFVRGKKHGKVRGKKHGKLFLPNGGMLVFSKTPSDVRASRNVKSELARLRRKQALMA